MRVIVDRSNYEKHQNVLSRYVVKVFALIPKVVLECDEDCIKYLQENKIPYTIDKAVFKPSRIPLAQTVSDIISLDSLAKLTGVGDFAEAYGYPQFDAIRPVCIIDSGVSDHPIFQQQQVDIERNWISKFDNGYDDLGHGTGVASIIATLCPYTKIVSIKMFGSQSQQATLSDILEALEIASTKNCSVINMSFGGYATESEANMLDSALAKIETVMVAAAGNDGFPYVQYPARSVHVIAVGSLNPRLEPSTFNNIDFKLKKPEFFAWGEKINVANNIVGYTVQSGTSFSTPIVASIAYWLSYFYSQSQTYRIPVGYIVAVDGSRPYVGEIRNALIRLALRNNPFGKAWSFMYGYGIPVFTKITKATFPKLFARSLAYKRPMPAKKVPISVNIPVPEIRKIIEMPVYRTEQHYYYYYYYTHIEKTELRDIQYIVQSSLADIAEYVDVMSPRTYSFGVFNGEHVFHSMLGLTNIGVETVDIILNVKSYSGTLELVVYGYADGIKREIGRQPISTGTLEFTAIAMPFDRLDFAISGSGQITFDMRMYVRWRRAKVLRV